jgi:hypothetical protein
MTPKEKAKELYFKMYDAYGYDDYSLRAKKCALIAVEELIKETGSKYWYDVKQEIEKL